MTPAAPENPRVFLQCTGAPDVCAALRASVERALERSGVPCVRAAARADLVVTATVTQLEQRVEQQFGTTFAVRTFSVDMSAEATRSGDAVPMPAPRTFSFDARVGRERLEENARVMGDEVADKVTAFLKKRAP